MKSSESNKKQRLEKTLRDAFSDRWKKLTEKEKEFAINKFYKIVWLRKITIRETLANIANKGLSFGVLFLGTLLAVFVGLVVNILDRYFLQYGGWYQFLSPVVLFIFIWFLNKMFEDLINEDYRDSNFLDELLKEKKD